MQTERRHDNQRRPAGGAVEIVSLTDDFAREGRAINISATGLCARVAGDLTVGDVVKLQLAMKDVQEHTTGHGRVVWCEPSRTDETAHVGLQLFCEEGKPNWSATELETRLPTGLGRGKQIRIESESCAFEAVVEHMELPRLPGQTVVRLVVAFDTAPAPTDTADEAELAAQVDRWTAHPLRDAREWCVRHLGPIWAVIAPLLLTAGKATGRFLAIAYGRLPERWRERPRAAVRRMLATRLVSSTHRLLGRTIALGRRGVEVTRRIASRSRSRAVN